MDQKYLSEIKAREQDAECGEIGAIADSQHDVKSLFAEVERLTDQHQCDMHNLDAMQTTLDQQAKNCENLLATKDQQIATLKKALKLACEEISDYALPSGTGRMKSVLITARIEKFMNHAKQVQEQEAKSWIIKIT